MLYKLHLRTLSLLYFALIAVRVATFAQVDKGWLLGTVADSSQAALAQVAIRAIDMGTVTPRCKRTGRMSAPRLKPTRFKTCRLRTTGINEKRLVLVPGTTRPYIAHSNFYDSAESLSTEANGQNRQYNNFLLEGINNN
jgi:hypothetical protein